MKKERLIILAIIVLFIPIVSAPVWYGSGDDFKTKDLNIMVFNHNVMV